MDFSLLSIMKSKWWKKNLYGFLQLNNGRILSDCEVRIVVVQGIKNGYKYLHEIPDEEAVSWINEHFNPKTNE